MSQTSQRNDASSPQVGGGDDLQQPDHQHHRNQQQQQQQQQPARDLILLTPYPVEPGHTLISISRLSATEWRPDMRNNAAFVAEGDNAGIVINKPASIMDYNRAQAAQKERLQPPSAKMSFKVFLINSETGKLTLEHRTLRFWLNHSIMLDNRCNTSNHDDDDAHLEQFKSTRTFSNIRQESCHLAQAYFCQLIGSKPDDDFPKNYVAFIMKLMRLLKVSTFARIIKMEVELRQLAQDDAVKPPSRTSSIDGSQIGDGSSQIGGSSSLSGGGGGGGGPGERRLPPLTSHRLLDIIESSYPNPISMREICSTTHSDETLVKQLLDELEQKEKISATSDDKQHFTRTVKQIDTKILHVKQMPRVVKAQQPIIAIITAQYCEKLAVDAMISDKETFVRYRTTGATTGGGATDGGELTSANYVYTLGNIGDHRVVSTKLTSVGHSRGALIAAGNATTRLLGTFPELEYVFLVGCAGGIVNYTDFDSHVRLGDVVMSHLNDASSSNGPLQSAAAAAAATPTNQDYVYVHCRPKQTEQANNAARRSTSGSTLPVSYSVHKNLKRIANGANKDDTIAEAAEAETSPANEGNNNNNNNNSSEENNTNSKQANPAANTQLDYEHCHFRLWRPAKLDLQQLAQRLWTRGLEGVQHRIWEYYIDEGIKSLKQQDIDASRPSSDTDKLFMSIGVKDTIEVSHPEAADDELDLRKEGRPMCHFGPIGSGRPALSNERLRLRMIDEFGLRAFDSEFDPVVESIYGNCKESYIMIRGISDYKDGRKRKEWQQYSALAAAAFMKSIIVNLKLTPE